MPLKKQLSVKGSCFSAYSKSLAFLIGGRIDNLTDKLTLVYTNVNKIVLNYKKN